MSETEVPVAEDFHQVGHMNLGFGLLCAFPISILPVDLSLPTPHCTLLSYFVFLNLFKACWFRYSGCQLTLDT